QGNQRIVKVPVVVENQAVPVLTVTVYSPVHIWVVAPDGTRLGYDPSNIPGGVVDTMDNGFFVDADEPAVHEHATILTPLAGRYLVELAGIGAGPYTVVFTFTTLDSAGRKVVETVTFTGTAAVGSFDTFDIDYPGTAARVATVTPTLVYTGPTTAPAGAQVTLSAALTASLGGTVFGLAGRAVVFTFGGVDYTAITDAQGVARHVVSAGHVA